MTVSISGRVDTTTAPALETALKELSRHQPNNQLCICSQAVIDNIQYMYNSIKENPEQYSNLFNK